MRKVVEVPKTFGNVIKTEELEQILNKYLDYRIETIIYGQGAAAAYVILNDDK